MKICRLPSAAPHLPEVLLREVLEMTQQFKNLHYHAILLSEILDRLYYIGFKTVSDWSGVLNILASQKRRDLMSNLPKLKDTVLVLASEDTLVAMMQVMTEVCEQWP